MASVDDKLERGHEIPQPPTNLLEEDGEPMESDWHRLAMTLLIDVVSHHYQGREDYFVGGNMFVYYSAEQTRTLDYRGPDFFFVRDAALNPPRRYWAIWDEGGRYPDLIIELTSPTTAKTDRGSKKDLYEKVFRTSDYFIYDPAKNQLEGWHLRDEHYEPLKSNEQGWLWCEALHLWLGTWQGRFQGKEEVYPRFYDEQGHLVLTDGEAEKEACRYGKESCRLRASARRRGEEAGRCSRGGACKVEGESQVEKEGQSMTPGIAKPALS